MKVRIDEEICAGCGLCVDTCPDVFEMGESVAKVKVSNVSSQLEECVKEAAGNCPVEAIIIE
ncbi:MAG: ferredoxin [Candidatus Ratteibacteria bacterium]